MASRKKNITIGGIGLVIGLLTLMMFGFEIRDGVLQGSRSYGMTHAANPITFYISTGLEFLTGTGLAAFGIYMLRMKD